MGKAVLDAHQSDVAYLMEMRVKLAGVAKLIAKHKSFTKVEGKMAENMALAERTYVSDYKQSDAPKSIRLVYATGGILENRVIVPEETGTRPSVPAADVAAVADPLTFVHVVRNRIDRQKDGNFSELLYDGKRLTRVDVTALGEEKAMLTYRVKRVPVKGYTEKELKKYSENAERSILLFFSNDEHLTLKQVKMETAVGWVSATLDE